MGTKHAFLILSLLVILLASGCASPSPAASPAATATPTPAPIPAASGPESIGATHSTQVKVTGLNITHGRYIAGGQSENISVTLTNAGDIDAQNVGFSIKEKDLQTGEQYFGDLITLDRPLPAGGSRTILVATPGHDYAFSVIINIRVYWGDKVEFWNGYNESRTLVAVPWG